MVVLGLGLSLCFSTLWPVILLDQASFARCRGSQNGRRRSTGYHPWPGADHPLPGLGDRVGYRLGDGDVETVFVVGFEGHAAGFLIAAEGGEVDGMAEDHVLDGMPGVVEEEGGV